MIFILWIIRLRAALNAYSQPCRSHVDGQKQCITEILVYEAADELKKPIFCPYLSVSKTAVRTLQVA